MDRFGNVEAAMARALLSEVRGGAAVGRCEPPTDLGTWIGTWLPGSLHFGRDPSAEYAMLDFSPAMHHLARERLTPHLGRTRQLLVDFEDPEWAVGLGKFDAVITH